MKIPQASFSDLEEKLKYPSSMRLAQTLRPLLQNEYLTDEEGGWWQFQSQAGPRWDWVLHTRFATAGAAELGIFKNPEPELIEFFSVFNGLRANDKSCLRGFWFAEHIARETAGFFSCGWFDSYAQGILIYSEAGGGHICRTEDRRYSWLVLGDAEPRPVANSFADLVMQFAAALESGGIGLLPYKD